MPRRGGGDYTVLFMNGGQQLFMKKGDSYPAPAGNWQGFWDPDLKEVADLTKEVYDKMPRQEKMRADAYVQAVKYAPKQFEQLKNEFWFPKK